MRLVVLGILVLAGVATVAYVAFADGEGDPEETSTAPQPPRGPEFEGSELGGTIYLMAGRDLFNADLYRARGSLDNVERLTRDGRISLVAAHDGVVVVATARGSGSDRLELANLSGGDALPGELIDARGHSPDLSRSGKLLYSVVKYEDDGAVAGDRVYVTEPRPGAEKRVVLDSRRSVHADWGPAEKVAVFGDGGSEIRVGAGAPGERTIDPGLGRISYLETNDEDVMAVVGPGRGLAVVPPDGAPRQFESDWDPYAWSPDGRALLAVNKSKDRLGLMSPLDGSVDEVGRVSGGKVFQAQWVADESQGG
jgi:hypothetical protein